VGRLKKSHGKKLPHNPTTMNRKNAKKTDAGTLPDPRETDGTLFRSERRLVWVLRPRFVCLEHALESLKSASYGTEMILLILHNIPS
jgi:hypothetical protein